MSGNQKNLNLSTLAFSMLPLRYATESCYITLTDYLYTVETIKLRNIPSLGKYINYVELSAESHESWSVRLSARDDLLNFARVAKTIDLGLDSHSA
jgi:hypothetical protein